jgi:tRNA modification GTPase
MRKNTDTIAAVATPPGEGGIAVVRVSGSQALSIAEKVFRPHRKGSPAHYQGFTVHYGQLIDPHTQEALDDGLLTVFRAPHSYTGEDTLEFSCHGGAVLTQCVLSAFLRAGARLAEPGEFTQRAFLNGKLDLAQAEAVADLIRAKTASACRLAQRQLEGRLSAQIHVLKEELVGILAAIEVTIDFSDEVGELEYAPLLQRIVAVKEAIQHLCEEGKRGRLLREGLRVAIIGRPNVGKSSLLNALLRTDRAIVTPIAGTTRDVIEEAANLQGVPVVLMDTAGLRETADPVEQIGVQRARQAHQSADLILVVFDATMDTPATVQCLLREIEEEQRPRLLTVWNKCDLLSSTKKERILQELSTPLPFVFTSAQSGEGMQELEAKILSSTTGERGASLDSVLVANTRHQEALHSAGSSLQEAETTTCQSLPGDFIAIDVRGALDALGQITGETVTEDIIHRIFRDFCVGK